MGHAPGGECGRVVRVTDHPSAILKLSGYRAVIEPDRWVPGSFTLIVDGTPQSHVNLEDPSQLFFEYIQRIGHVIDLLGEPHEPITAVLTSNENPALVNDTVTFTFTTVVPKAFPASMFSPATPAGPAVVDTTIDPTTEADSAILQSFRPKHS